MLIFDMNNYPPTEPEHITLPESLEMILDIRLSDERRIEEFGEDIGAVLIGSGVPDLGSVSHISNGFADRYEPLSDIDEKVVFLRGIIQGAGSELSARKSEVAG